MRWHVFMFDCGRAARLEFGVAERLPFRRSRKRLRYAAGPAAYAKASASQQILSRRSPGRRRTVSPYLLLIVIYPSRTANSKRCGRAIADHSLAGMMMLRVSSPALKATSGNSVPTATSA